ncbi:hypothetical protein [Rhodococcus sp. Leaf278]|uniref:hypothetical protein n=1 Tax=Rhodococcus sp. Leaf278 TaxID=1736319 RepID=UPI000B1956FC|nr:hypothetical protein [Rhodococcus sp. Leaf278]
MIRRSTTSPIASATGPARSGVPSSSPRLPRSRRRAFAALGAVVCAAVAAAVLLSGGDSEPDTTASDTIVASSVAPTTVAAGPDCSMPTGDQNSGPGVIAAFEHAYYVQRSGAVAHALVSPNAPASAPFTVEANLDAGIATVPAGTTYCLDIDPLRTGSYTLILTESGPNGPGTQYRQRITTDQVDGRYVIAAIEQA